MKRLVFYLYGGAGHDGFTGTEFNKDGAAGDCGQPGAEKPPF